MTARSCLRSQNAGQCLTSGGPRQLGQLGQQHDEDPVSIRKPHVQALAPVDHARGPKPLLQHPASLLLPPPAHRSRAPAKKRCSPLPGSARPLRLDGVDLWHQHLAVQRAQHRPRTIPPSARVSAPSWTRPSPPRTVSHSWSFTRSSWHWGHSTRLSNAAGLRRGPPAGRWCRCSSCRSFARRRGLRHARGPDLSCLESVPQDGVLGLQSDAAIAQQHAPRLALDLPLAGTLDPDSNAAVYPPPILQKLLPHAGVVSSRCSRFSTSGMPWVFRNPSGTFSVLCRLRHETSQVAAHPPTS